MKIATLIALVLSPLAATLPAQNPVDLRNWAAEHYAAGAGNWVVSPDGISVNQSLNGWPTVFYGDAAVQNQRIEGTIQVTGSDDDYMGFALGFQPGDATNPNADYLLVDWKRITQTYGWGGASCTPTTTAQRGLAVSRVEGRPTADEMWGHVNLDTVPCSGPTDRVTELQRGTNLGAVGWVRNQVYTFRFDFTASHLDVFVDNVLELSITGTFRNGRMAFYNFSQSGVIYRAFTSNCLASWSNYGTGHPGTLGVPGLAAAAQPILGTTVGIELTGVSPSPAFCLLAWGWSAADLPSGFGGQLMLQISLLEGMVLPAPPMFGTTSLGIPLDQGLCGVSIYCQYAHFDAGASHGFAFSPAMRLILGN